MYRYVLIVISIDQLDRLKESNWGLYNLYLLKAFAYHRIKTNQN